mmetsp:Transcript_30807/g.98186  ORF Transcript_30807/g.98186 Transcript_30807/m.98186 type:complete len:642 (+) Transcript_30807:109-2034(+)
MAEVKPSSFTLLLEQDDGEDGRTPCRMPGARWPCCPPDELHFDMFFFRQLFEQLELRGFATKDHKVHITVVHNVSVRLMDAIGLNGCDHFRNGFFARGAMASKKSWYTWQDLCRELKDQGTPEVILNTAERIYMTLDDPTSSRLARAFSVFMAVVILGNLTVIVLASMHNGSCGAVVHDRDHGKCGGHFQTFCIIVFTLEYLLKLFCIAFVRVELFHPDIIMDQALPRSLAETFAEQPPLSRSQRVIHFLTGMMNLVDLVSILPFWLKLTLGPILPPSSTSFLRVIRVTRVFRILKTGRYLETLQVLFRTLARSGRSMIVLMLFVAIVALISGVVLHQLEESLGFESVPHATFWVLARLIAMKDCSWREGTVTTAAGVVVLTIVMALKGILWILPVGQIKAAFDDEFKVVSVAQQQRQEMEYELNKPTWSDWYSLRSSCRAYLDFWVGDPVGPPVVKATLPVPILHTAPVRTALEVPAASTAVNRGSCGPPPSVGIQVDWEPSPQMLKAQAPAMPVGFLRLQLTQGSNFPVSIGSRWHCRMQVPVSFCGESIQAAELVSNAGGPQPVWDQARGFEVRWAPVQEEGPVDVCVKEPSPRPLDEEADFRKRALALLEEQGRRLEEQGQRLAALELLLKQSPRKR